MLRYHCPPLSRLASEALQSLQNRVDAEATREEKYKLATALFANKASRTFDEIREKLANVAPPGESCFYCERDRYRDIDHIRPKRHYPGKCFAWENYVYACTICNQDAKRDTYAVFNPEGAIVKFDRSLSMDDEVPVGPDVLIDPRHEDPLEFLQLDLETGCLVPIGNVIAQRRGEFTRDLLRLNESALCTIRVQAFRAYGLYLDHYHQARQAGDTPTAERILQEVRGLPHPTVLVEMRRQKDAIPLLQQLFDSVPVDIGARP